MNPFSVKNSENLNPIEFDYRLDERSVKYHDKFNLGDLNEVKTYLNFV